MDTAINRFRAKVALARLRLNWWWLRRRAASYRLSRRREAEASLVLVPCEPWSVIGSRGDEAMVYSILRDFRRRHPEGAITIVTGVPSFGETDDGKRLAHDFGTKFAYAWRPRFFLSNIMQVYKEVHATEVCVLGADCMDGHWSQTLSIILLAAADIAARMGIFTRLTGFSWNDHPANDVVKAFENVTHDLPVLIRDPVSYERFMKDVRPNSDYSAKLVADVAFNLTPRVTPAVKTELNWMESQRNAKQFVLGFNLHSMLVEKGKLNDFLKAVIEQLKIFLAAYENVSFVLIPHDYRNCGDLAVLSKVAEGLLEDEVRVKLVTSVLSAEELKALTVGLDALFTSRMHLGIAALGMGRPIAAFSYQGKFVGLFRHFQLPVEWNLEPGELERLPNVLGELVAESKRAARQIADKLPTIGDLARNSLLA